MLTLYHNAPKQTRALDAIRKLKAYFERQGINEKEPLPNMQKIVDYCLKYPRLLRIRDSPLKYLHDPDLPYTVVHDWYIGIALDYLEASIFVLLEQWKSDYMKKRNDKKQIAKLFAKAVNDIYQCYEHTGLALGIPFPEGCALAAVELKEKVRNGSRALIKSKISYYFTDARNTFYTLTMNQIEALFKANQPSSSFAYLFSPHIMKYRNNELETKVQMFLDVFLPKLVDVFNLPDDILDNALNRQDANDEDNEIDMNNWLMSANSEDEHESNDSKEVLEAHIQTFSTVCEQLNNLDLTPNWAHILKETVQKRLQSINWEENADVSIVQIQLKWLHVLILPWLSHLIPKTDDVDMNWYNFLREKIKAEHVLYEVIYQAKIPEIFDIVLNYPDTECIIKDLHASIIIATKRGLLEDLRDSLMREIQSRLLHQGASAVDILQYYIDCIKSVSVIDPSCNIMESIIELIEHYLKTFRKDVTAGVVDLIRNAHEYSNLQVQDNDIYVFKKSELNNEEMPLDAVVIKEDKPAQLRRLQQKSKDSIAMLISMCSSLKDFIKGYSDKLGHVLLSTNNYDTIDEIQRLELLKRNFPPDTFLRCDVMLQDITDSRRLDTSVHLNNGINPNLHAIIVSRKYWPGGNGEDDDDDLDDDYDMEDANNASIKLWPGQQESIEEYDQEFRKIKKSRKLKFLPTKGSVRLNLEFESRTLTIDVSPEAATILSLFEGKEQAYTRNDIMNKVKVDKAVAVDCLEFWMKKEVLGLSADGHYQLIEE
ncbi:anaphase-promoting complex subunit 2-like [Mucor ambiguus]|uniref:Anaphase-promoting complex subunit 2-like n=1 Tax=Mucor ambiguus TaxID=91626 RepID=A0A0C9MR65_9FUNG|nr:anaphase-promoting complex subunit 2-like [Mucor ambiguus]